MSSGPTAPNPALPRGDYDYAEVPAPTDIGWAETRAEAPSRGPLSHLVEAEAAVGVGAATVPTAGKPKAGEQAEASHESKFAALLAVVEEEIAAGQETEVEEDNTGAAEQEALTNAHPLHFIVGKVKGGGLSTRWWGGDSTHLGSFPVLLLNKKKFAAEELGDLSKALRRPGAELVMFSSIASGKDGLAAKGTIGVVDGGSVVPWPAHDSQLWGSFKAEEEKNLRRRKRPTELPHTAAMYMNFLAGLYSFNLDNQDNGGDQEDADNDEVPPPPQEEEEEERSSRGRVKRKRRFFEDQY